MKYRLFPDEYQVFLNEITQLEVAFKDAWKLVWEAMQQSSETWHDNAPMDVAKLSGELASRKLAEVQVILNQSQIVRIVSDEGIVSMGKTVSLLVDGNNVTYTIGGYQTPIEWRVSYNAPLIRAILGKEEGEVVYFDLNGKNIEIEILGIHPWITL